MFPERVLIVADVRFTKIHIPFLRELFELWFKEDTEWAPISIEHHHHQASSIKLTTHKIMGCKPNQHNSTTRNPQPKNLVFYVLWFVPVCSEYDIYPGQFREGLSSKNVVYPWEVT